jgi:hypothetical protein
MSVKIMRVEYLIHPGGGVLEGLTEQERRFQERSLCVS